MFDKGDQRPTAKSRELRNHATPAERRLWTALSARKLRGVRFNRQFPVGPFICDFVTGSARLVIEVDGYSHDLRLDADAARTRFLQSRGYRVLRFTKSEVMQSLEGVAAAIEMALAGQPLPRPLPQAGGKA